jgi:hypothetical protein
VDYPQTAVAAGTFKRKLGRRDAAFAPPANDDDFPRCFVNPCIRDAARADADGKRLII